MSLWTAAQAVAATGGSTQGDWFADGVSIDSRSLQRGDLFVALQKKREKMLAKAVHKDKYAPYKVVIPLC